MQDAHDVGSCEDDAELEGELRGIGIRGQLALVSSRACLPAQQVTPLLLHPGHLVMDAPGPGSDLGGGGHEEAAPGEDPPLDVGEIAVAQRQQAIAAWLRRGQRGADDLADGILHPGDSHALVRGRPPGAVHPRQRPGYLADSGSGFTIVGAGKTAMDACVWLLEQGVDPGAIRWIRPRDAWLLDRKFQQPLKLLPALIEGVSLYLEAAAEADSRPDLFRRLEDCGQLVRLDPRVTPTMFRSATVSDTELGALRSIEHVVRLGRVRRLGTGTITLASGSIPTDRRQIHIDCSAAGLPAPPPRPVFEPGRITLQLIRAYQPVFSAALAAFVETARTHDTERNVLCPANPWPSAAEDWIRTTLISHQAQAAWSTPDISGWLDRSRLNAVRGIGDHAADPRMQASLHRLLTSMEPALENLAHLAEISRPVAATART